MDEKEVIEQKEILELVKNTKGYNWKIRLDNEKITEEDVKRLEVLNNSMLNTFGGSND